MKTKNILLLASSVVVYVILFHLLPIRSNLKSFTFSFNDSKKKQINEKIQQYFRQNYRRDNLLNNSQITDFNAMYKSFISVANWTSNKKFQQSLIRLNMAEELRNKEFWESVHNRLTRNSLYAENDDVDSVLHKMRTGKIIRAISFPYKGASLKWIFYLSGGQKFLFKPNVYHQKEGHCEKTEYEVAGFVVDSVGLPWSAFELFNDPGKTRENGVSIHEQTRICQRIDYVYGTRYDIMVFKERHRMLGYRRAPYATGRVLDIASEILVVADVDLKSEFFSAGGKDLCIMRRCPMMTKRTTFCFKNGLVCGALIYWVNLPVDVMHLYRHPFHYRSGILKNVEVNRSHLMRIEAPVNDHRYCDVVRKLPVFKESRFFMDLNDVAILDFLIANEDRRYSFVKIDGAPFLTVHFDHGYAFIRDQLRAPYPWNIAPVRQCCRIRKVTWDHVLSLKNTFRETFDRLTRNNPLPYPILTDKNFDAVKRRISYLISLVDKCVKLIGDIVFVPESG